MAVYKVPQDVEADDKLIGPFSFRQFIYLIIVAISMAGAYGLSTIFAPLVIIPLPIIIFFAALALPLRKDQPMEAYLSAVVSFYFLKSRKRFWQPDGIDSFITIIPPKNADKIYTKDLDQTEATKRLDYLATLVDTHGWSIRGAGATPDTSINTDLYYEGQQAPDIMDTATPQSQAMTQQLQKNVSEKREQVTAKLTQTAATQPQPTPETKTTPVSNTPTIAAAPITTAATTTAPTTTPAPAATLADIESRTESARRRHAREEVMDALTVANGLAEANAEERKIRLPAPNTTPVPRLTDPEPAPAIRELTTEQARAIAAQRDVSIQTMAKQASRTAEQNKVLKSGEEVTIRFR